jgi:biotin carboxyl carrier protein
MSDAETAVTNATEDTREKIEEAMSDRESTIAGTPDTTPPAPAQEAEQQQATPPAPAQEAEQQQATPPAQESSEKGGNVLDQIWGTITNLFK